MKNDPQQAGPQPQEGREQERPGPEEILEQSIINVLMNVTPDQLIRPDRQADQIKGNAYAPGGWLHAPGNFEIFASGDERLTKVAEMAGMSVREVGKIGANVISGTKLLVIKAALPNDTTAFPVSRHGGSSAWVNLYDLLNTAGLLEETGYRSRYDITYIPKSSNLWPGLLVDLGAPKERCKEPVRKRTPKKKKTPDQKTPDQTPDPAATGEQPAATE